MKTMWDAVRRRKVHFLTVEHLERDERGKLWAEATCSGKRCRFPVSETIHIGQRVVVVENLPQSPFAELRPLKSVPVCLVTLQDSLSKLIKVEFRILQPDIFPLTLEPWVLSMNVLEPDIFPLTLEPLLLSMSVIEPRVVFPVTLETLLLSASVLAPEIFPLTLKPLLISWTVLDPDIRLLVEPPKGQVLEFSLDTLAPDVLGSGFDLSVWLFEPYVGGIVEYFYSDTWVKLLNPLYPLSPDEGGIGLALNATSGKDFVFFRTGMNTALPEKFRYSQAIVCSNVDPNYSWDYRYSYKFEVYVGGTWENVRSPYEGVFKHPEVGSIELVGNYVLISRVQNGEVVERKIYDLQGNPVVSGTTGVITAISNASNEVIAISGLNRRLFINGQEVSEHPLISEIPTDPALPFPAILDKGDFVWRGKPNRLVCTSLTGQQTILNYSFADGTYKIPTVTQFSGNLGLFTCDRDYKHFYVGLLKPQYYDYDPHVYDRYHDPVYFLQLPRYGRYVFL